MDEAGVDLSGDGEPRRGAVVVIGVAVLVVVVVIGGVLALWAISAPDSQRISESFVYEVLPAGDAQPGPDGVAATVAVLERRLDGTGAIGRADGTARIAIDVPAGADRYVIRDLSAPVGRVEFVPLGDNSAVLPGDVLDPAEFPPLFSGEGLSAEPSDDASGGRAITLRLDDPAAIQFADYTAGSMGEYLAVTLDSEVVVAPLIETAIPDGVVQFSSGQAGGFTPDEVNRLVRLINAGALPFPLQELAR